MSLRRHASPRALVGLGIAAIAALPLLMPATAHAWWVRPGFVVGLPRVVIAPAPVFVAPPAPVFVAPPPVAYAPPPLRWVPPHYNLRGVFIPGHYV